MTVKQYFTTELNVQLPAHAPHIHFSCYTVTAALHFGDMRKLARRIMHTPHTVVTLKVQVYTAKADGTGVLGAILICPHLYVSPCTTNLSLFTQSALGSRKQHVLSHSPSLPPHQTPLCLSLHPPPPLFLSLAFILPVGVLQGRVLTFLVQAYDLIIDGECPQQQP